MLMSQYDILESTEKLALQRFSKKICQHLMHSAVADNNITGLDAVLQPEISDILMAGFRPSRGTAVLGKLNGSFFVLLQNAAADTKTLGFHEHLNPNRIGKVITGTHGFSLRGALGIEFLFGRFAACRQ
jgi:hypothetical protein